MVAKKKVLLVSSWAPHSPGGALNLYNMLSQLLPESYCILTRHKTMRHDPSRPRLPGKYFFCDYRENVRGLSKPESTRVQSRDVPSRSDVIRRKNPSLVKAAIRQMRTATYNLLTILQMVRVGLRAVRDENIQSLVGVSDAGPALIATFLISVITGVPYALYLFDIYLGNNLSTIDYLLARIFEPLMFNHASMVVVTNEGTEQFYRKRYGNSFRCAVIHNSIFPGQYEQQRTTYSPREPFRIVFTGYIYWPQERSIMNLIKALEHTKDLKVSLELYVPNIPEIMRPEIANRKNIHVISPIQAEMPAIQCNATVLFLPLSWHTKSPQVIATATPGKLTDYMAAGRPILIHAPPYAYITKYAKENRLALVVEQEDSAKLAEAVRKLTSNAQYSRRLIANALRTYYRNHNAKVNARKFAKAIASI